MFITLFLKVFANALPGAISEGLIWGIMAIGVYISYKILDIADLTVDGSICTGACVCLVGLAAGLPAWVCLLLAFLAGAAAGTLTGLLHTALGIPSILSGILTQLILYSVNLYILGGKSLMQISSGVDELLVHSSDKTASIISAGIIVAGLIVGLWLFFYTEIGLTLKSTGDNPDMSRAQGVNVNRNKVIGLAISNGIVAMAGALYGQYNGFADLNMGRGAIVIGLAAIFIGLSVSMKIKPNFVVSLIGVVGGGVMYYIIYSLVTLLMIIFGLKTDYLKMFSAIIVILFLAVPYLYNTYIKKNKKKPAVVKTGGNADA